MDLSAAAVKRGGGTRERGALTLLDVATLLRRSEGRLLGSGGEEGEGGGGEGARGAAGEISSARRDGSCAAAAAEAPGPRQAAAGAALARAGKGAAEAPDPC